MNSNGEKADVQAHSDSDRRVGACGPGASSWTCAGKGIKRAGDRGDRNTALVAPEMALFSAGKANLDPVRQFEDMAAASAKVILDAAAQKAKVAGVTCEFVHIPDQHPAEGIIAIAEQKAGPHHHGVSRPSRGQTPAARKSGKRSACAQ